jgi:uncharacterized membrane protein
MIQVIFHLRFFKTELVVFIILLIIGAVSLFRLLAGKNSWTALFVFFSLNALNLFAIYARTLNLTKVSLPVFLTIIGLYMSAFRINSKDDAEVKPYYEEKHTAEQEEEKLKKAKK